MQGLRNPRQHEMKFIDLEQQIRRTDRQGAGQKNRDPFAATLLSGNDPLLVKRTIKTIQSENRCNQ